MNNQKGVTIKDKSMESGTSLRISATATRPRPRFGEPGESYLRFINPNSAYFFSENRPSLQFIE